MDWKLRIEKHHLFFGVILAFLCIQIAGQDLYAQVDEDSLLSTSNPIYEKGTPIYTDIDTVNQRILVVLSDEIWEYDLKSELWNLIKKIEKYPEPLVELEFGYDAHNERLLFWSRGVGRVFEFTLTDLNFERIDQSFSHSNQFGHFPFFREGELHAFAGYGFWLYKNYITFFNPKISEWNIVTVASDSEMPEVRVPMTGAFIESRDELYIYGGTTAVNARPDDRNVFKEKKKDIWKFSFKDNTWKKIDEFEDVTWDFLNTPRVSAVGNVNAISRSFYSQRSGHWYLPVFSDHSTSGMYFVAPYHLQSKTRYGPIELQLGDSKDFIISNFHFNQKSGDIILVGLDHLTNTTTYPMRVLTISEDSLLSYSKASGDSWTFIIASIFAAGGILLTIIILVNSKFRSGEKNTKGIKVKELLAMELFNETEMALIKALWEKDHMLETSDLEELVWSEIDSYDYRRKLRNETIKSINNKYRTEFEEEDKLVIRKKDPNDHRRLHYGLNKRVTD